MQKSVGSVTCESSRPMCADVQLLRNVVNMYGVSPCNKFLQKGMRDKRYRPEGLEARGQVYHHARRSHDCKLVSVLSAEQ